MSEVTVLQKFINAFPNRHRKTKSNDTIALGNGATIYFRTTKAGPNTARIHSNWVRNFPNSSDLESYLRRNRVPTDARPDYLIGHEHADRVIAILKSDN